MGKLDAEAGGPRQQERAEREWAAERERSGHDRSDQTEARESETNQKAVQPASEATGGQNKEDASSAQDAVKLEGLTITKEDARRQEIKDVTGEVLASRGRKLEVTSEHRDNSTAHQQGAIDYRSKNISSEERHEEAKEVSEALGEHHTVVVETVHRPEPGAEGPTAQIDTAYRDGQEGKTRVKEVKATETHTHVQPDLPKN